MPPPGHKVNAYVPTISHSSCWLRSCCIRLWWCTHAVSHKVAISLSYFGYGVAAALLSLFSMYLQYTHTLLNSTYRMMSTLVIFQASPVPFRLLPMGPVTISLFLFFSFLNSWSFFFKAEKKKVKRPLRGKVPFSKVELEYRAVAAAAIIFVWLWERETTRREWRQP